MKRTEPKEKAKSANKKLRLNKQVVKDLDSKDPSSVKAGAPYVSGQQCGITECCTGGQGTCWKTGYKC